MTLIRRGTRHTHSHGPPTAALLTALPIKSLLHKEQYLHLHAAQPRRGDKGERHRKGREAGRVYAVFCSDLRGPSRQLACVE